MHNLVVHNHDLIISYKIVFIQYDYTGVVTDRGCGVIILNKQDYVSKLNVILDDSEFKPISEISDKIRRLINHKTLIFSIIFQHTNNKKRVPIHNLL